MKEIIDKISSYNLFNYLFPGIIFVIFRMVSSVVLLPDRRVNAFIALDLTDAVNHSCACAPATAAGNSHKGIPTGDVTALTDRMIDRRYNYANQVD